MTRDIRRKPDKERQQKPNVLGPSSAYVRSPALQSAEEKRSSEALRTRSRSNRTSKSPVRLASERQLVSPGFSHKRLPRLNRNRALSGLDTAGSAKQQRSGLTADWRTQAPAKVSSVEGAEKAAQETKKRAATVQAITEEEQEKLDTLEMRLPRIAGKIDGWLLIIVLTLLCIGIVTVYSASSFQAEHDLGDASYYFQRQLMWTILGVVAMLLTLRVDYRHWRRFSLVGMLIILPLLVIVLKFGVNVYGASRWLSFGSFFTFQPSELTKLVLALYIADWLARKGDQVGTFLYGLVPFVLLVGVVLGLVLLENDLGTAIIIAGFATAMFFTAGANVMQFLLAVACAGLIFFKEAFSSYRFYRMIGFINPFKDVTGINLQLYQALLAFGSGGWFGLGLGNSRQKTGYLPFPYTDSIFPIIGEELGFIGCAVIVMLFLALAFRGFRLARRTPDLYGALLATGITTWLVLQAIINIGANTGTIPYTGVPLPFISFGGSSLVVSLAAVGVLLNISRYIQEPETPALWFRKKRVGSRYITSTQQF
ncbi:MAG TPA: putative lipid II flippase FtsW [Ktedonobacteraceae bacterium]|nr:putative lipid II flippase FtsW [Ktedonobacteraceae bacterium]